MGNEGEVAVAHGNESVCLSLAIFYKYRSYLHIITGKGYRIIHTKKFTLTV